MRLSIVRRARPIQVGFIVLLTVCTLQVAYWIIDEVRYTAKVEEQIRAAYETELESARALLRAGEQWNNIAHAYPVLLLNSDSTSLVIDQGVLDPLAEDRFHRLNRYAWEGAFFLIVLLASIAVVYRAVREEGNLRQRQEDFLAVVSHELQSPLASLRLSVETLAMRDPPAARRAELVDRLLGDLERLQHTITNVLDTSRLSSGKIRSMPERRALADEVLAVVEEMREQLPEGSARVTTDVPDNLAILADPDSVRTVVRNLLHNAIKATEGGGEVSVRAERRDGQVRLEVRDNGIGFPPGEAHRLSDKFYRVSSDQATRAGGTGLGLYIVRRCAELDGGTLTVSSAGPGRGASFVVTWPAAAEIGP